ncbi:MAG: tRNA 2-thiouridine(34) synthase MnmA [Candidatus Dormibacteria bacterium]
MTAVASGGAAPGTCALVHRALPQTEPADLAGFAQRVPAGSLVAVAMSGGVDSSVAAALCAAAGVATIGVTMRLWGSDEMERGEGGCCSLDAVEDARRVCARLGIPHYVLNMRDHFERTVVRDFLEEYGAGRTPNPCIRCNETVKFKELLRRVAAISATHVATGHYARVSEGSDGILRLRRGADPRKDQSYTLYRCDQAILAHTLLPLGELQKSRVRQLASDLGLGVARKPDSQDLCFVGGGDHRVMLERELAGKFAPGPIVDLSGAVVGTHRGLPFYTVGQRHGLGGTVASANAEPRYVVELDASRNLVVVGPRRALEVRSCQVARCSYPAPASPRLVGLAQARAHAQPDEAVWTSMPGDRARVDFKRPQIGIAPGQSLVLYDDDRVVAGGEVVAVVREGIA